MALTILKIGGSIITRKGSDEPEANLPEVGRICREIKSGLKEQLVLIHGAGSYGHPIVKRTGIHKGIKDEKQKIAFAKTQALQNELNSIVCRELVKAGVPGIPIQPSSSAVMKKGKLVFMDTEVVKGLLELGLVPVLYGVPAYDSIQGCSILSGDSIITYLAKKLNADRIIHASNVDGVYDKDPNKYEDARLIRELTSLDNIKVTGSNHIDVTGGMYNKVIELLGSGVKAEIINGSKPGRITKALKGTNGLGTIIKPS